MADPGIGRERGGGGGGGGGAPARVWQGVGRISMRAAPGRVRVGERCKLPHLRPRSQRFLRRKPPQKYAKNVITDRGWGATDQYMFNAQMHRR